MRLLIFGKDGQVGRCLLDQLKIQEINHIGLSRKEVDITNQTKVNAALNKYKPTVVINAAAYTLVKGAEKNTIDAYKINKDAVRNIAIACTKYEASLIHISTDYVFDGIAKNPYKVDASTNPVNAYGISKLAGELELRKHDINYIILRTSWVFSEYGNNFVKTILNLAKSNDSISVVSDQVGSPTYAGDIAKGLILLSSKFKNVNTKDIYHISGGPSCSWHEFAKTILNISHAKGFINNMPKLIPILSKDYDDIVNRPAFTVLDCNKYFNEFKISPYRWEDSLYYVIKHSKIF